MFPCRAGDEQRGDLSILSGLLDIAGIHALKGRHSFSNFISMRAGSG